MYPKTYHDEIIAFAQEIVRIKSLSGEERDVAKAIAEKMGSLDYDDIQVDPYGSVIASRVGRKPGPRILFDSHMDVVPVPRPDEWSHDPYGGEIQDGKIWGRGASDMKGPLAAALVSLGHLPRDEFNGTLIVSTSVHEEKYEGAALQKVMEITRPDFVVICEPNGGRLGIGQKGRAGITVDVLGKPAHSSFPHLGENAVYKAIEVIRRLQEMPLPSDEILGDGFMELIDGISRPYPSLSTLPVSFFMHYDRRLVLGETQESVMQSVRDALAGLSDWEIDFQRVKLETYTGQVLEEIDFHPGWVIDVGSAWVKKAQKGLAAAGIETEYSIAKICTNGSYSAGIAKVPTIIFGPSSVMLAHTKDEYIEIKDLILGADGYWGLASELSK
ncbi:MAG: YgeY family selenium metabolism-linked hydrolase [Anaerolineaceae bacterium]|nr:YgeY family selenium metabolism-linked hydrolase [Anaerolineaceae bacterium]